jgi:hypothetical protein
MVEGASNAAQKGFSEMFNEGWEASFPSEKAEAAAPAKKPCKDCPGGEESSTAPVEKAAPPPFKVLKVQGKEVPVKDEAELIELAQKGLDYTRKTQGVADERREVEKKYADLDATAAKFNEMMERLLAGKPADTEKGNGKPAKVDLYEEYGIDEALAEPYQKKFIQDLQTMKDEIKNLRGENENLTKATKQQYLQNMLGNLTEVVKQSKAEFPIDEQFDESGDSLTKKQFVSMLTVKATSPQNKDKDIGEMAKETIREIHLMQKSARAGAPPPEEMEKMDAKEFAAKYPGLFKRIQEANRSSAVEEYVAEKSKLPPSLTSRKPDVDASKSPGKDRKFKSAAEALDAGFDEIDFSGT